MSEPQKFYVRFSNIEDFDKIMRFYAENPHNNVCGRHPDLIRELVDNGSVVLIEDANTGKLVGASISYPLFNDRCEQEWLEVGTTRMVLNGYPGLFDVMIGMQVLRAYLVEPPNDRFVCQMASPLVQKMAQKLGFRAFRPSEELVDVSDKTLDIAPGESYGYDNWFAAGVEALPVMAKMMQEAIDKGALENPKTGEKIILDFSKSKFFSMFEKEIRALAKTSFGDADKPDPKKSVAVNHRKWMHHFFK